MPNPEEVKLIHLIEQNRSAVTAIAPVYALFYKSLIAEGVDGDAAVKLTVAYFRSLIPPEAK